MALFLNVKSPKYYEIFYSNIWTGEHDHLVHICTGYEVVPVSVVILSVCRMHILSETCQISDVILISVL